MNSNAGPNSGPNSGSNSNSRPNFLIYVCDQLQAQVLDPQSPCITPNFDRLAARGVRFTRAYTACAICSPARASLMTGLLPHNHGVLEVLQNVDKDQSRLRTDKPHWAQRLQEAGYHTGYFGKWHVERSNDLRRFGWHVDGNMEGPLFRAQASKARRAEPHWEKSHPKLDRARIVGGPPGYEDRVLYGVTECGPEARGFGVATELAYGFIKEAVARQEPWCCFVSFAEPHDPYIANRAYYERYDPASLPLPASAGDDMADKPGLYRKCARVYQDLTERERREAMACYYATVTQIDEQFGRLLDLLDETGAAENTIVILTSDHGDLLGAHGFFSKNISAFEEVYNIPMVVAGPGVVQGQTSTARVGLHDLCPTLIELAVAAPIPRIDARSFAQLLRTPGDVADWQFGYAEYHGGRYKLTQRIVWDGPWKLVHNGFDEDELYNHDEDPWELRNRISDPSAAAALESLYRRMWQVIRESGDHSLYNSHYPPLRLGHFGPGILETPSGAGH